MNIFSSFTRPPIGLDIGTRLIKAVQLGQRRGQTVVTASAGIGRSNPDAPLDRGEVSRLSRVLAQQGFAGRSVVLAVPSERLMSSVIDMPPRDSGAPYDVIAAQEFARLQRQEPGGFELSWWDVPRPARASTAKVMAIGCAHADSDPVLDMFQDSGFDVMSMGSGLCATVRACRALLGPASAVSAVLDMGWGSSRLALVHGGVVVFDRVLAGSGLASLHGRVCKALSVELAEADALVQSVGLADTDDTGDDRDARINAVAPLLRPILMSYLDEIADELVASFEYTSHQYPGAETCRLVLAGGGGCVPGMVGYLDGRVAPEVVAAQIAVTHTNTSSAETGEGSALMAAALGLAGYGDQG
jgi:type IV pilus assembly protein PilM